jgi:hypothetical protein
MRKPSFVSTSASARSSRGAAGSKSKLSNDQQVVDALEHVRRELVKMIAALEETRLELNLQSMALRDFQTRVDLMRDERRSASRRKRSQ